MVGGDKEAVMSWLTRGINKMALNRIVVIVAQLQVLNPPTVPQMGAFMVCVC